MYWYPAAAAVLLAKFFAYSAYAKVLNRWFDQRHPHYQVGGVRALLSLVFTGINFLIVYLLLDVDGSGAIRLTSLAITLPLAALAWYILMRIYYRVDSSPVVYKALGYGLLISVGFAIVTGILSFFGFLSSVNFC